MRTLDVPPEPIENNWYHTQKSQKVIVRQVNYGVYWGYRDFFTEFWSPFLVERTMVFETSREPRHIAPLHEGCKRRVDDHSVVIRQSWLKNPKQLTI